MLLSVSLWKDLSDPMFDGVGLMGFKIRANAFLLEYFFSFFCLLLIFLFLLSMGWLCGTLKVTLCLMGTVGLKSRANAFLLA